jgi:L-rhamnose mutarotase
MATVSKEKASSNIVELLKGGLDLKKDVDEHEYKLNGKKISAEEYERIRNELFAYLDKNCEVQDRYDYMVNHEVILYNCPIGKVGVYKVSRTDGKYEVIYAEASETAWAEVKDEAIMDIWHSLNEIVWPAEGNEEELNQLMEDLYRITELPN